MGTYFLDQYSLLHFVSGILCRHLNISFTFLFIFHIIFEYIENSKQGMYVINNYFKVWPGGKPNADTFINSVSDIILSLFGWLVMDIFIKNGINYIGTDIALGVLLYFWIYPTNGMILSTLLLLIIYKLYKSNLIYGFLFALLLDYLGLHYRLYEPHTKSNL
jgi:hypothetical protein